MITVVAALIENNGKYLIAKRLGSDESLVGKWEFPGGKVEKNESEKEAIEREIFEEFELKVKCNDFICNNVCEYPTKTVDLRLYSCNYISGNFHLHAHSEYKWVSIGDMSNYDFADADVSLVNYLMEKFVWIKA